MGGDTVLERVQGIHGEHRLKRSVARVGRGGAPWRQEGAELGMMGREVSRGCGSSPPAEGNSQEGVDTSGGGQ